MGHLKHGILGQIQGKVGPVVGVHTSNLEYIRQRNKKPKVSTSEAAVLHRTKFGVLQMLMKEMKPFIDEGVQYYSEGRKTLRTTLMKYNIKHAITGLTPDTVAIDFSKVRLTRGSLALPYSATAVSEEIGKLTVTWGTNITGERYASEDDRVTIGFFHPDTEEGHVRLAIERRDAGAATLDIPFRYSGSNIEVWILVSSEESKLASHSLYVGNVLLT